jgi:hypothetical protein
MKHPDLYIASVLLLLALSACAAVFYFEFLISDAKTSYVAAVQDAQQQFTEQNSSVSIRAVVQDTAQERAQLDTLLSPDVASIANTLRNVGKAAKVSVKLGGAVPEYGEPQDTSGIQAVDFTLSADGSFSALMRTEALIETLPLPSSIERFDIQRNAATGDSWHMDISTRVLTTAVAPSP